MKPLYRSTAGAMILVAIVAVDFALARAVYPWGRIMVIGATVPCVALQIALLKALRAQGRWRAFWLGFLFLGGLCTATFVDHMWPRHYLTILGPDGAIMAVVPARLLPLGPTWEAYARLASRRLVPALVKKPDLYVPRLYAVVCWSAPQLLSAIAGAGLAWAVFGGFRGEKQAELGLAPSEQSKRITATSPAG